MSTRPKYRRLPFGTNRASPARLIEDALAHLDGHPDGGPTIAWGPDPEVNKGERLRFKLWLDSWVVPHLAEAHVKLTKNKK